MIELTRSFWKYKTPFIVPDGSVQDLIKGGRKFGYNSGVYGWNYSAYRVETDTKIYWVVFGYRNHPKGKTIPLEKVKPWETKARKAIAQTTDWNKLKTKLNRLLVRACEEREKL